MELAPQPWWEDDLVRLFQLTPDHVGEAYVSWLNDAEVNRFLESRFDSHSTTSVRAFVTVMRKSPHDLMLGIHDRKLDKHVGNIKIGPINDRHSLGEIGLMIGAREAWGRGLGSSAIARVADIGFKDLGLRKLSAGCYASNVGSARAFERAGFVREGLRRAHVLMDGRPEDVILLGKLNPL